MEYCINITLWNWLKRWNQIYYAGIPSHCRFWEESILSKWMFYPNFYLFFGVYLYSYPKHFSKTWKRFYLGTEDAKGKILNFTKNPWWGWPFCACHWAASFQKVYTCCNSSNTDCCQTEAHKCNSISLSALICAPLNAYPTKVTSNLILFSTIKKI